MINGLQSGLVSISDTFEKDTFFDELISSSSTGNGQVVCMAGSYVSQAKTV